MKRHGYFIVCEGYNTQELATRGSFRFDFRAGLLIYGRGLMPRLYRQVRALARGVFIFCAALLCALFINACDWDWEPGTGTRFAPELRGTWVSTDSSVYSGTLEITSTTIAITGYAESQTFPWYGNDAERPFKGFTKGTPLSGYSERDDPDEKIRGSIYIKDVGEWQTGIPYIYYTGNQAQDEFLRFDFGGRQETLQKSSY